jgi:hypothetical protein
MFDVCDEGKKESLSLETEGPYMDFRVLKKHALFMMYRAHSWIW